MTTTEDLKIALKYLCFDLFKKNENVYRRYQYITENLPNWEIVLKTLNFFADNGKFPSVNELKQQYSTFSADVTSDDGGCLKCGGDGCLIYLLNEKETAFICPNCKALAIGALKSLDDAEMMGLTLPDWQAGRISEYRRINNIKRGENKNARFQGY